MTNNQPHNFQEYQIPENYIIESHDEQRKSINMQPLLQQMQDNNLMNLMSMGLMPMYNTHCENPLKKVKSQMDIKQEDKAMVKNESSTSLKDDVIQLQNIKGNVKNAYIKKINSLLNVSQEDEKERAAKNNEPNSKNKLLDQTSSHSSFKNIENDDMKMQKNRESARNSRQRKKLYIGLLEKKVEDLNNQIEGLRQQCELSFKHIHSILEMNPCLKGMIIEQAQIFDQLQIKDTDKIEGTEMQCLLTDSYKLKFSATGSKRKAYIKYCFQNIIKSLLEGNYGPLLFGCNFLSKKYQVLDDEEFSDYLKNFKDVTGFIDENKQLVLFNIIRRILDHKKSFKSLIKEMKLRQRKLRMTQQQLEDQVEEITGEMTTVQFITLLQSINKGDQVLLKEELPIIEQLQYRNDQQAMNPMQQFKMGQTPQILQQLPMEFLFNAKNNYLLPNNIMIDPLQLNDIFQKRFCKS